MLAINNNDFEETIVMKMNRQFLKQSSEVGISLILKRNKLGPHELHHKGEAEERLIWGCFLRIEKTTLIC